MRKQYGQYDPNIFKRWTQQGKVEKVKNGLYRNTEISLKSDWDRFAVANNLQQPSYVSLHSALYFYDLIPEYVFDVTSVSTKKTQTFSFRDANYYFRQLKKELYFGYHLLSWGDLQIKMATLEKALVDFAYLEPLFDDAAWLEEMRFDEDVLLEEVDWERVFIFASYFNSAVTLRRLMNLQSTYSQWCYLVK